MDLLGLVFECIFLAIGVYLYLFARGKVRIVTHSSDDKAEAFRKKNGGWLRILALFLIAVMSLEIVLHLRDLVSG